MSYLGYPLNNNVYEKFKCDLCEKSFKDIRNLKYHMDADHDDSKFCCENCNRIYNTPESL